MATHTTHLQFTIQGGRNAKIPSYLLRKQFTPKWILHFWLWGMISVSLTTHFTIHSMEIDIPPSRETINLNNRPKAYVIARFQQGNMSLPQFWVNSSS